ncbi:transposase, partial [Actinospica sp.]|uniref:transposase n=1 Tax=Actinospica sp. TaxID=1872142 RepID=UPI002CE45546
MGLPPANVWIVTPYDTEARTAAKRSTVWTGYKVQLSETCDPELPHVITYVETVTSCEPDRETTVRVHAALAERGLRPAAHLADWAYVDAEKILEARLEHEIELIGPTAKRNEWQRKDPDSYGLEKFTINWDERHAVCPQGHTSGRWYESKTTTGHPVVRTMFRASDCRPCPACALCTKGTSAKGRTLALRPRARHELLAALRADQGTEKWRRRYAARAGVEGAISQAVRGFGLRKCRYRGHAKAALQLVLTATAVNLARLDAWMSGTPLGPTRVSHLAGSHPRTARDTPPARAPVDVRGSSAGRRANPRKRSAAAPEVRLAAGCTGSAPHSTNHLQGPIMSGYEVWVSSSPLCRPSPRNGHAARDCRRGADHSTTSCPSRCPWTPYSSATTRRRSTSTASTCIRTASPSSSIL